MFTFSMSAEQPDQNDGAFEILCRNMPEIFDAPTRAAYNTLKQSAIKLQASDSRMAAAYRRANLQALDRSRGTSTCMQSATELSTAEIVQAAAAEAVARKPVKDRAADYRAEYAANPHYAKFGISEAEYIASRKIDEHGISFIPALSDEQLEQLSATLAEPVAKSAAAVSFAVGSEHFLAEDAELVIV